MAQSPAPTCKSQCWRHKPAVHRWSEGSGDKWSLIALWLVSLADSFWFSERPCVRAMIRESNRESSLMFYLASSWVCTCTCSTNTLHTHRVVALDDRLCETMNGLINTAKAINEVHPYTETEGYLRDIVSEKYKVICIMQLHFNNSICNVYAISTMRPARLHIVLWAGFFPECVKRRLAKGIETFSYIGLLFTFIMKYSKIKMTES